MTIRIRCLRAGAAGATLFLGGCLTHHDDPIALSSTAPPSSVGDPSLKPAVVTARQTEAPAPEASAPFGRPEQIPTADQIFDFHPPGSKANQWRQPFDIEDHGGPLEIYRKQTAAMLKQLQDPDFQQPVPQASSSAGQKAHQP